MFPVVDRTEVLCDGFANDEHLRNFLYNLVLGILIATLILTQRALRDLDLKTKLYHLGLKRALELKLIRIRAEVCVRLSFKLCV